MSRRWVLWLGAAAAGACIALGTGHGVASAESDGGAGPSPAESSQSAEPFTGGDSAVPNDGGTGKQTAAGPESIHKPSTTASASTVRVRRDKTVASGLVDHVKSALSSSKQRVKTATPAVQHEAAGSQPVAAREAEQSVDLTAQKPTAQDQPAVGETAPVTVSKPQPAQVDPVIEVTSAVVTSAVGVAAPQPITTPVVATVAADVTATSAPAAAVAQRIAPVTSLAGPVAAAPQRGPLATVVLNVLSGVGLLPPTQAAPAALIVGPPVPSAAGESAEAQALLNATPTSVVTGVKVGHSELQIPVGTESYTGSADWYFPTQADGTVQAQGVMWLQHGFLGRKSWYSALAQQLAQQTNSIVVVPNIPSFPFFRCDGCTLSGVPIQQGVAALFADPNRESLTSSAQAAGLQGALPEKFVLTGHSAGGGLAAAAGGFYTDAVSAADNDLLGVVMFDGVSSNGTFAGALASLDELNIPVYQIAAPPQPWNANGQTTNELVALRPGQFVGDVLANGSHVDSLIGGAPLIDFISQLVIKRSTPGNTQAVYTLAAGWINDMYVGRGPMDPLYGTYGEPDQYIVLGETAAVVLGPPPVVVVNDYLGTWYELGSVRQFFSIGLVNTKAVYTLNPDGSIRVENSGNYFLNNGPKVSIIGSALPVDPANNKLNVTFFGPASATPPGNYWIVDLAPDYSWAIVSDPNGTTGFLLSRTPTVSDDLYQELLDRASVKGVKGRIVRTRQPAAGLDAFAF